MGIVLLKKEGYGMQCDRPTIGEVKHLFVDVFDNEVVLTSEKNGGEARKDWMKLHYKYNEFGYDIEFETDYYGFYIHILKGDKFFNLQPGEQYNSEFDIENVRNALLSLKAIIKKPIHFYVKKGKYLYVETEEGELAKVRRIVFKSNPK